MRAFTPTRQLPAVAFELRDLPSERNRTISALANGYRSECGCSSGSFFLSAAVVASAPSYFLSGGHLSGIGLRHIAWLLAIAVTAALLGKLAGLVWARWQLIRLAARTCDAVFRRSASNRFPING